MTFCGTKFVVPASIVVVFTVGSVICFGVVVSETTDVLVSITVVDSGKPVFAGVG